MKAKSILTIILLSLLAVLPLGAQSSLALLVQPGAEFPLGENSELFTLGGTVHLGAEVGFGPGLFVSGGVGYNYTPIDAESSLSVLQAPPVRQGPRREVADVPRHQGVSRGHGLSL